MYGFARVQAAVERRQRFEDQREKWVETREEDGGTSEYLMVRCEESRQPWPRQRVLRFNEDELREWQTVKAGYLTKAMRYNFAFAPLVLLAIWIAGWVFSSFASGLVALVVTTAIWFFVTVRRGDRLDAESKATKRRILSRHGNIPANDVGMADQYYKNYVILPTIPC